MAKTNTLVLTKMSSEDVRLRRTYSSWSRCLEDVLKTSSEDEDERRLQDVFIKANVCWAIIQKQSHIRDKVKVVLGLPNYANKKELEHATVVDTSDLDDKKDLIAFKAEVDKLDISKLVNVPNSLNNFYKK